MEGTDGQQILSISTVSENFSNCSKQDSICLASSPPDNDHSSSNSSLNDTGSLDENQLNENKGERICRICGDIANGVHYNVLSCEGCKSFFLRSTKSGATFTCNQGGKCDMDLYTRRHCPACRMKRCLDCGMNIERVWDDKRLQTRKPLIRTKRKRKVAPSAPPQQSPPVTQSSVSLFIKSELSSEQEDLLDKLEKGYCASTDLFRNITREIPEKFVTYWNQAKNLGYPSENLTSLLTESQNIVNKKIMTEETNSDPEAGGPSNYIPAIHRVTAYLTKGDSEPSKEVQLPQHCEPLHKEMLHLAMDMFATVVKQTIHFAKSIPGFTELTCDDQAMLIKSSIVDALLLRCTESFELEKGYLENPFNGDKFDIHMMYYLGFSTLPEPAFKFMRETKACGLNKAEFAMLTAVAITAPDRSDLKNRELVEQMQALLISTLYSATKHYHPEKPLLFADLISKLTTLRDMSVLHLSELMEVKVRQTDLSPLVVELFGLDS